MSKPKAEIARKVGKRCKPCSREAQNANKRRTEAGTRKNAGRGGCEKAKCRAQQSYGRGGMRAAKCAQNAHQPTDGKQPYREAETIVEGGGGRQKGMEDP